jgi:hypothetical protein
MRRKSLALLSLVLWISAAYPNRIGAGDDQLRIEAAKGHRSARESILTVHAHLVVQTDSEVGAKRTVRRIGDWWQDGKQVHWIETAIDSAARPLIPTTNSANQNKIIETEEITEGQVLDGVTSTLAKRKDANGNVQVAGFSAATAKDTGFFDIWSRAGFVVQDIPRTTLLQLLDDPSCIKDIQRVNGVIKVVIVHSGRKLEAWLDPRHGYLATRILVYHSDKEGAKPMVQFSAESTEAFGSSAFFPTKTIMKIYGDTGYPNSPLFSTTTDFSDIQINRPIETSKLNFVVPSGTPAIDRRNNTSFVVGKNNRPDPKQPIISIPDSIGRQATRQVTPASALNWWPWAVGGLFFLIGTLGCLYIRRKPNN